MSRNIRLVVRLANDEEYALRRFAQESKLPLATLVRALLLREAERHSAERAGAGLGGLAEDAVRSGDISVSDHHPIATTKRSQHHSGSGMVEPWSA